MGGNGLDPGGNKAHQTLTGQLDIWTLSWASTANFDHIKVPALKRLVGSRMVFIFWESSHWRNTDRNVHRYSEGSDQGLPLGLTSGKSSPEGGGGGDGQRWLGVVGRWWLFWPDLYPGFQWKLTQSSAPCSPLSLCFHWRFESCPQTD